jgi:hypothetical protein
MQVQLDWQASDERHSIPGTRRRPRRKASRWVYSLLLLALACLTSLFGGKVIACAAPLLPDGCGSPQLPPPTSVRIERRVQWLASPDMRVVVTGEGSGTVVGSHTILTHGHYHPLWGPRDAQQEMVFVIQDGNSSTRHFQLMSDVDTPYVDRGTTLLVLSDDATLPDPVTLGNPAQLRAGDEVSVVYWDDASARSATLVTTVSSTDGRVARVADPGQVIGSGDSGSGVYNARGELVGNVWSIELGELGRRVPWFEVALLPAQIEQHIS